MSVLTLSPIQNYFIEMLLFIILIIVKILSMKGFEYP